LAPARVIHVGGDGGGAAWSRRAGAYPASGRGEWRRC